ncbi:ABC transporter ATP-binding protein [Pseudomonas segetis]|uniref:Osmoprotectant transport system ATP-binding protein n=1 Tax=Pseudomonas segetis TaxID=298908 RepID=A0A239DC39_9PSED|nr:ABC transporter ATP-binding protein [Pseudomonas segetis]SNS29889.1 osmoprotectant transport system ATP-binding protein [Pseudomonas segetis]
MSDAAMIELRNVSRQFGDITAVDKLSLRIEKGEICVFIGTSGCGKSTTLRLLNKLIDCSSGEIWVDGEDVASLDSKLLRRRMGYAIQSTGLFPHWTVERNIGVVPRLLGWPADRIDARVRELLELLSLPYATFVHKFPSQLSGGQAQRVGVARALAADPDILLMDEPFGALDPITREALQNELLRIQSHIHKTIVFVTHDIDEALRLATRIVVMDKGRIVQHDTPENLLNNPVNSFVEDLLGQGERGLKRASLERVEDFMLPLGAAGLPSLSIEAGSSLRQALSLMLWQRADLLCVRDQAQVPLGILPISALLQSKSS